VAKKTDALAAKAYKKLWKSMNNAQQSADSQTEGPEVEDTNTDNDQSRTQSQMQSNQSRRTQEAPTSNDDNCPVPFHTVFDRLTLRTKIAGMSPVRQSMDEVSICFYSVLCVHVGNNLCMCRNCSHSSP
jgi:hypothetical protein